LKKNEIEEVLRIVADNRPRILNQIPESQIAAYATILKDLHTLDVASDAAYQRAFAYFYRLRLRPPELKPFYFKMLNDNKHRSDLAFEEVLETIFARYTQVHPSFSSKLVATVNPDKPVYDSQVLKLLGLKTNWQSKSAAIRVQKATEAYKEIESFYDTALRSNIADDLVAAFDERFQSYTYFTKAKKLDLFLWQGGTFLSI